MKILVVSQYFYPENFRINQLCLDLKDRGHQITVLTGKPNYPKGEYFDGYSFKGDESEVWNDIPIIRVPLRARKSGSINLLRNYLSFVYHGNKKIRHLEDSFDLIYVFEVSPITVALPAIKLKKKKQIPIIMNVQDLWPENIIAVTGITNKLIIKAVDVLVNYIYKNCDLILTASPSFVNKIKARGIDTKIEYWPQYSIVKKCEDSSIILDENRFNIVFTGNIGEAQGIDLAIEAAKELHDYPIHWHFIGDGRQREFLEKKVKTDHLDDVVTFYGYIPEKDIPAYLAKADAALLILKPDPIFEMTIPAKLQTYLSCGVPILGCVSGESKRIIKEGDVGLVTDKNSVKSLIKVCKSYMDLPTVKKRLFRENALKYCEKYFKQELLLDKLTKYMEELI